MKKRQLKAKRPDGISTEWYYILKYIAIITMVMEHTITALPYTPDAALATRTLGRMAFPLFAFELVECFCHTERKGRHLFTIGILALVSEIPFDIALFIDMPVKISVEFLKYQNVCFTFFFGFLAMWGASLDWTKAFSRFGVKCGAFLKVADFSIKTVIFTASALICTLISTDYSWRGILFIMFLYIARKSRHMRLLQFLSFVFFMGSVEGNIMYLSIFFSYLFIVLAETVPLNLPEKASLALRSKASVWIGRCFYPAHLIVLSILKIITA